jgi:hypothetical protein
VTGKVNDFDNRTVLPAVQRLVEINSCRQRGREVSVGKLQCFGEELLVPSGALSLSLEAVGGGMMH